MVRGAPTVLSYVHGLNSGDRLDYYVRKRFFNCRNFGVSFRSELRLYVALLLTDRLLCLDESGQ